MGEWHILNLVMSLEEVGKKRAASLSQKWLRERYSILGGEFVSLPIKTPIAIWRGRNLICNEADRAGHADNIRVVTRESHRNQQRKGHLNGQTWLRPVLSIGVGWYPLSQ